MRVTTITCDRCGLEIRSGGSSWRVSLSESHGAYRGTMGKEQDQQLDFCGLCGYAVWTQIRQWLDSPAHDTKPPTR